MPTTFAITAADSRATLDARREGEASFTVTNLGAGPVRGRARLVASDAAAQRWLALAGDAEREFPPGGTAQIGARLRVPPDAPAGRYTFRLDMVGVDDPDEDYTQGPAVGFEVPAGAAQPAARPFPWWIVAVGAGALAIVVIAGLLLPRPADGTLTPTAPVTDTPAGPAEVARGLVDVAAGGVVDVDVSSGAGAPASVDFRIDAGDFFGLLPENVVALNRARLAVDPNRSVGCGRALSTGGRAQVAVDEVGAGFLCVLTSSGNVSTASIGGLRFPLRVEFVTLSR